MSEQILNIAIRQGSTFEWLILIKDVDGIPLDMALYTGGTAGARGKLKKRYTDTVAKLTFDTSILSSAGVIDAIAAGLCHLTLEEIASLEPPESGSCYLLARVNAAASAGLKSDKYFYDLEIEDPTGYVFKPYVGIAVVGPEATT